MSTPPIVSFVNQKGGVGKTSTTLGIASAAVNHGLRTLVVDTDPQGNATTALGVDAADRFDLNDLIEANTSDPDAVREVIVPSTWAGNIDVIPASLDLAKRDGDNTPMVEFRLRKALNLIADDYDLILIDCSPSVGKLVMSALIASSHVLVIAEPSAPALAGVENLRETIEAIQEYANENLSIAGIVVNRAVNTREAQHRISELQEAFGDGVLEPHVPMRSVVAEALGAQTPVHAYLSRAKEMIHVYDALLEHLLVAAGVKPKPRTIVRLAAIKGGK